MMAENIIIRGSSAVRAAFRPCYLGSGGFMGYEADAVVGVVPH
jgi:hypothetical protein